MKELSIIIPYIQEYPQILFTIRSIHEELRDIPHEIIAIDNLCEAAKQQLINKHIPIDRGHQHIKDGADVKSLVKSMSVGKDWLKYIHYDEYFSCWQSRNQGIINAEADIVMFIDAHCVPSRDSISGMFSYYKENWHELNGSIHLPLTYHILEDKKLIYKFVYNKFNGRCEYSFSNLNRDGIFEVPCMSSCGLMLHKSYFDMMGLFPQTGIYAGGEHFFNYVFSIMGKKKWIYAKDNVALHHHGEKRDYNYTWGCYQYNRAVANYMFGDEEWLNLYVNSLQIDNNAKKKIIGDVLGKESNIKQRDMIKTHQVISIEDWADKWKVLE